MSGGGAEVGIHWGVGGAVSGDDNIIGEPDGETGGDDGVGCVGQVICIYPYVPLNFRPPQFSLPLRPPQFRPPQFSIPQFVQDYIPMAIEAGIIGIHGMEPAAGMDMARLKKEFGKDLVLMGNVDGNEILCQPDLELVRKEVKRSLKEGMEGGGFMLSIAGAAHEGIHLDALIEMCRYNQKVGVY